MKKNDLVRCRDTFRLGVVVDFKRTAGLGTLVRVKWPKAEEWVPVVDLEFLD